MKRLVIVNLGVLSLLIPFSNVFETIFGINTSKFARVGTAVMGQVILMPGNSKAFGSASANTCVRNFTYDLDGARFKDSYKVFGDAYYYGCRPGIDIKYKVGEHVKIYIGVNEISRTDFSRWGFQSWFLLQQIVYCLIILAVFAPWFISALDKPLPWWLQLANNSGNEK